MQTIGSYLLVIGILIAAWQYAGIHGKEVAEGRVTALEKIAGSGRGGSTDRLVAAFPDRSGTEHTYRAAFGVSSTGYAVGDRIRIYFDRDNPADCGVLSFGYRFGVAWGFVAAGVALWLLAAGFTLGNGWLERLVPTTVPAARPADQKGM
ncbi:MAG TPA: DUF3592 domain-containing protein [Rhodocyclaceae bacterium]